MTPSLPQSHHDYSFADYLAIERESEIKHEFDAGEILVESLRNARIRGNLGVWRRITSTLETSPSKSALASG